MLANIAAAVMNVIGITACAAVAAHWTWHEWAAPAPAAGFASAADPVAPMPEPEALATLFGDGSGRSDTEPGEVAAPFALTGIVITETEGRQAVLRPAQGAALAAGLGDALPGGFTVREIGPDGVVLWRDGRAVRLQFPAPEGGAVLPDRETRPPS